MPLAGHRIAQFPGTALRRNIGRHTFAAGPSASAGAYLPGVLATIGRAG